MCVGHGLEAWEREWGGGAEAWHSVRAWRSLRLTRALPEVAF